MTGSKGLTVCMTFYIHCQCASKRTAPLASLPEMSEYAHFLRSRQLCFIYICINLIAKEGFSFFFFLTSVSVIWNGAFLHRHVWKDLL